MDLAIRDRARFERDIAFLASPALTGRLSGSPGARIAANYLARELAALGLQPMAGHGFLQPVPVPAARLDGQPRLRAGGREFRHRRDFAELAALSGDGRAEGPLRVLDGDSIDSGLLSGSVLLIRDTPPDLDLAAMAQSAAAFGAQALLVEAGDPEWFYKTVHAGGGPLPLLRLRRSLAADLAQAADMTVALELQLSHEKRMCHNVLARLPGRRRDATVLLLAHYDHVGDDPGGERFPGAFDNASGVALVLGLMRTLTSRAAVLPFDVLVAFTTGEESGLFGARHLLATVTQPIIAAINLDSLGSEANPLIVRLGHGQHSDWLAEMAAARMPAHGLDLRWIEGRDDSQVFRMAGIPTLGLGQQPSHPRANPMHTPEDVPERLHAQALVNVHAAVSDLITHLAHSRAIQPRGSLP
jgi:aminopeptidase YwaD